MNVSSASAALVQGQAQLAASALAANALLLAESGEEVDPAVWTNGVYVSPAGAVYFSFTEVSSMPYSGWVSADGAVVYDSLAEIESGE